MRAIVTDKHLLIQEPCQLHALRACNVALGVAVLCATGWIQGKLWPQTSSLDIACMVRPVDTNVGGTNHFLP